MSMWLRAPRLLPLGLLVLALAADGASAQPRALAGAAEGQLRALRDEKRARSPVERKLSSRLLFAARMRRGEPPAPGIASLRTGVEPAADGRVLVDLRARVTPQLLERIAALGGELVHASELSRSVRAHVPLDALEKLAARDEVRFVAPADRAYTRRIDASQGDVAHRADRLRADRGVDGSGVAVGVLSDGVAALGALQASGDLPAGVVVLPGQAGRGSEGSALLEIVHDLAPGAALLFATGFTSQASFASNIRALRAAGADVIVDDVGYLAEAVFQDDDVAASVAAVSADGALYFSAAGNAGRLDAGTSGVWEGDFRPGAPVAGAPAHDFGAGTPGNAITEASRAAYTLQWSDPQDASGNDYDLLLLDASLTRIVAASTDAQDGDDDPFEQIDAAARDEGRRLLVVRDAGADRFLRLDSHRGELAIATPGQIHGHAGAREAIAVAAARVPHPPAAFSAAARIESFSSDGPRRVFFLADGSELTPGNRLAGGGELRAKPDLAAADCVRTATEGYPTFCGTSAAAPHAAAIAALLIEAAQGRAAPARIRAALAGGALDIGEPGADRNAGSGIVDAERAAAALAAPPGAAP